MPVRIYEIAKKFGLDSKVVLAKAKELGIIQANKTASSSIDKITAEYLEKALEELYPRKATVDQAEQVCVEEPKMETGEPVTQSAVQEQLQEEARSETVAEVSGPTVETQAQVSVEGETERFPAGEELSVAASVIEKEPTPSAQQVEIEPPQAEKGPESVESGQPSVVELQSEQSTQAAVTEGVSQGSAQPDLSVKREVSQPKEGEGAVESLQRSGPFEEELVVNRAVQIESQFTTSPPSLRSEEASKSTPIVEGAGKQAAERIVPPLPKAEPPKPGIGEKVGFIQLPSTKRPQPPQKAPQAKPFPPKFAGQPSQQKPTQHAPIPKPSGKAPHPSVGVPKGASPKPSVTAPPAGPKVQPRPVAEKPQASQPQPRQLPQLAPPPNAPVITMKPPIIVRELAYKLNQKPFKIIADLIEWGIFANANQAIEEPVAKQICAKYGFRFELERRSKVEAQARPIVKKVELDEEDRPQDLKPRPPVVTIMGHVDHGKTTLLDKIRKSNVAAKEVGGITQHIGAYTISVPHPDKKNQLAQITFIDTPGHAAFSAMRARGANVTDIVVLVVAANEGVMPQTEEALAHARAAGVPIIVAVNKCDHPNANPLLVRKQLQERGLIPDEWGGDTIFVDISALTGQGVDKLLEMILLQAELMELRANPNRPAKGNVIESGIEPGGPVATLLVRKGTLRVGDFVLCGTYYGKVRALINDQGQRVKEAGPSIAVKMLGLNGPPEPGTEFMVVKDEETARKMAEERLEQSAKTAVRPKPKVTLEELLATIEASKVKTLKLVIKGDTNGSVEAITGALRQLKSDKVNLEIVHAGVGAINENDVLLAAASQAVVIGFQTKVDSAAAKLAKQEGVQIKLYQIIYELIDEVRKAMLGLLEPVTREVVHGRAEVKKIFQLSKGLPVAGCVVTSGRIIKGKVRVLRNNEVIYEGAIQSMRHYQDEVAEVKAGMECGIRIDGFGEFQPGDVIESYSVEKVQQEL